MWFISKLTNVLLKIKRNIWQQCCLFILINGAVILEKSKIRVFYAHKNYICIISKIELVNEQFDLNISRQSVYLHEKELSSQYIYNKEQEILNQIKKLDIKPSGYYRWWRYL